MPMNLNRLKYNGSLSPVRTIKASKSVTVPSGYFSATVSGASITATSKMTLPIGSGANAPSNGSVFVSGSGLYFSSGGAFIKVWGA